MSNPYVAQYHEHADWGVGYSRTFQHLDEDGVAISNVGSTAVCSIRQDYATDPVLSTAASQITVVLGGSDGKVTISVTEALMKSAVPTGQYADWDGVFDIVLESSGQAYFKLIEGSFTIHPTASET